MAEDIQHFTVIIPTGSTAKNPAKVNITMPPRTVSQIDWKVPPGHMGTMSFLVAMAGVPVLPVHGEFTYVTADNKDGSWQLSKYPDSGGWQVIGYNTGSYAHQVLLTFYCDLPAKTPQLRQNLPPHSLSSASDLSRAGPPVGRR